MWNSNNKPLKSLGLPDKKTQLLFELVANYQIFYAMAKFKTVESH